MKEYSKEVLLKKVLLKIKPSKEEYAHISKETKKFLPKINKRLRNAKAVIGGSFERNTWISGNYDVDIFVKFNYKKYKDKDISKELERVLKNLKKTKLHGSRDYFQVKQGKFIFELVPVLDVKNYRQALNVTDVSPLHSKFVKQNSNKKIQDEIRLTKQFLDANNLYGAESYIGGFSGYLTELLVIYYKSLETLIKNVAKWQEPVVIDIKRYYKNPKDTIRNLNWAKKGPLIVIDPVQKNRNAAAALSRAKFEAFKNLSKQYLKNPSIEFFQKKEFNLERLNGYAIIEIIPKSGKHDIVGAKLLKLLQHINKRLAEEGFDIIDYGWHYNKKTYFWFKVENETLDNVKKHYGPFVDDKKNLQRFKEKWQGYKIYTEKKKTYILLERKFTNLKEFLKNSIKENHVKENVKKIKLL